MSLNPKYAARKHATSKNFQRLCGYQDCTHEPVKECGVCSRQFCDDHVHHTWYTVWGDPSMPTRTGDPPVITMQGDVCPNCRNWKDIEVRYELGQELIEIENEYKSRIKK